MTVDAFYGAIAHLSPTWRKTNMMNVLFPAIKALPDMLADRAAWKSKYIDYEEPYLMRLYRQFEVPSAHRDGKTNALRLNLHYFFGKTDDPVDARTGLANPYAVRVPRIPDADNPELYHFHAWAAGFFLFQGGYKQDIGMASETGSAARPPVSETRTHHADDTLTRAFAFNSPLIWHRVIPQGTDPVCTLMVSYVPEDWGQYDPPPPVLRDLADTERTAMFGVFDALARAAAQGLILS